RRDGDAAAGILDDAGSLSARVDDGIFRDLRHARLRRSPQLPGFRRSGTVCRDGFGERRLSRYFEPRSESAAIGHGLLVSRSRHAETDMTEASGDQVGFDLFFTSGV